MTQAIINAMAEAEQKAWEALAGYKFWMFGYHAARWVNYNNLLPVKQPSPFRDAVKLGREKRDAIENIAPSTQAPLVPEAH